MTTRQKLTSFGITLFTNFIVYHGTRIKKEWEFLKRLEDVDHLHETKMQLMEKEFAIKIIDIVNELNDTKASS